MKDNNIKIAALQETKLNANSKIGELGNFTILRKDRQKDSGGGLAFLIDNSIKFETVPVTANDEYTECQAIKVENTTFFNIYFPPVSSCTSSYKPTLNHFLSSKDAIILGDFNAHDSLWHSAIQDARGCKLAEEIGESNFGVLNQDTPTRLPTNGQATSPDFTLASLSLLPVTKWETVRTFSSDHLPIVVSIYADFKFCKSENRTFTNFNKANWEKFTKLTEKEFEKIPPPRDVYSSEMKFRKILNKASNICIPSGRIKEVVPEIPTEAARLINQRDELRKNNPNSEDLTKLNQDIKESITNHRSNKWKKTVEEIDRNCSSKLFKLIKRLTGNQTKQDNQPIKFKGKYYSCPSKIADQFNKQYSSVIHHKSSKETRKITKNVRKNNLNDQSYLTANQTKEAIKRSKNSKAMGPDRISNLHLKHLGEKGILYLTGIFNLSLSSCQIPSIWKCSTIIPLLKPSKDPSESKSYRPVSLLCPAIKILERLVLPTLEEHLEIPDFQHGFRAKHSTMTALHDLNQAIATGFNQDLPPDRTLLVQLDLSKAFDMVSHNKLIKDINETNLPDHLKRWMSCYLRGRQSKVQFRNKVSKSRNVHAGVPQGAVSSPLLFSFYLAKLPSPPSDVHIIQYADDISIYTSGTKARQLTQRLNKYLDTLLDFLEERELLVSPEKSTVTYFSPDKREANYHPNIKLRDKLVKLEKTPKILGVIFDQTLSFSHHIEATINSAKSKVNIMKCLAGSDWGQDKETLILTYKSIGRSVLEYGNPIWSPAISPTNWRKLQVVQNDALRIATGCLKMTSASHLHQETKVPPIKNHATLLAEQFLLATHLPGHPGQKHLDRPPPPRNMKGTVLDFKEKIDRLAPVNDQQTYKQGLKNLHTSAVRESINSFEVNSVLNTKPPEINPSESQLNRKARTKLAQLRSGHCSSLNEYRHRIDPTIDNKCPDCEVSPHDVIHLFNCQRKQTNLKPEDMWNKPVEVAAFLNLQDGDRGQMNMNE